MIAVEPTVSSHETGNDSASAKNVDHLVIHVDRHLVIVQQQRTSFISCVGTQLCPVVVTERGKQPREERSRASENEEEERKKE